jgi:hypothetical protein
MTGKRSVAMSLAFQTQHPYIDLQQNHVEK